MKYFTPARYLRLGNLDDERAFLDAQDEWERAIVDYKAHLRRIRGDLPGALRRLIENVYLHDARVVDMVKGKRSRFTITLQPESTPEQRVVLAYSLIEPARIDPATLPEEARSEPLAWLYDELDVLKQSKSRTSKDGVAKTFRHAILLSNGWEIQLRFRSVAVMRPVALVSPKSSGVVAVAARSSSE
jgi:hypothetical protein